MIELAPTMTRKRVLVTDVTREQAWAQERGDDVVRDLIEQQVPHGARGVEIETDRIVGFGPIVGRVRITIPPQRIVRRKTPFTRTASRTRSRKVRANI